MNQTAFISNMRGNKSKCISHVAGSTSVFIASPITSLLQTIGSAKLTPLSFFALMTDYLDKVETSHVFSERASPSRGVFKKKNLLFYLGFLIAER